MPSSARDRGPRRGVRQCRGNRQGANSAPGQSTRKADVAVAAPLCAPSASGQALKPDASGRQSSNVCSTETGELVASLAEKLFRKVTWRRGPKQP